MSSTNAFEETILKYLLKGTSPAALSTVYLGLALSDPGETGVIAEPPGTYSRIDLNDVDGGGEEAFTTAEIEGSAGQNLKNETVITFDISSEAYVVTHYFIADTGDTGTGTILHYNELSPHLTVGNGQRASFPIDTLIYNAE